MRIGVFDSGVGGLSVLEAMERRLPHAGFYYCCDSLHFPYGTKSEAQVIAYTTSACLRFVEVAKLDILVIACNTASSVALPAVREQITCPVVGVVPAVKPAAANSRNRCIGVLATHGAVKGTYLQGLIDQFAGDCEVRLCGSSRLVELAEQKVRGLSIDLSEVKSEIAGLFLVGQEDARKIDAVVLGCTHFPILKVELEQVAPWPVEWIDSGDAIAARVEQLMSTINVNGIHDELDGRGFCTGPADFLWGKMVPDFAKNLGLSKWKTLG